MGESLYLRPTVSPQPLIHRWYAWPQSVSPISAGFSLRSRQLAILDSYLQNPKLHHTALANPARMAGPFLNPMSSTPAELTEFRDQVRVDAAALLGFADDIDAVRVKLGEQGDGRPLTDLYPALPESLRGLVELVYNDHHQPSVRFFEALVYRSELFSRTAQQISLLRTPDLTQPFIFNSPILASPERVDVRLPFDSPMLDDLYQSRLRAAPVDELVEKLGIEPADVDRFTSLFTTEAPPPPLPAPASGVRMRYLGHAGVLLESAGGCVLLDPIVGYAGDGLDHLRLTDLPPRVDAIVLSHAHADHVSLETLLQLRHRVGAVIVPGNSGSTVIDPSLASMLLALGFPNVIQLGDLETHRVADGLSVTAVPFLGEHADLDIRAKMVPLVEISGRRFLFATDTVVVQPELYERIIDQLGDVDALFIGLECVGAPMSWLYGPLLAAGVRREYDQTRRLSGSDAVMADRLARLTGAKRVYSYAMGLEPWLRHMTGSAYHPDSEQVMQSGKLDEICAARGVPSELLYLRGEHSWS